MKKFEYMTESYSHSDEIEAERHIPSLNAKGQDGWELVSVIYPSNDPIAKGSCMTLFFKREIESEVPR